MLDLFRNHQLTTIPLVLGYFLLFFVRLFVAVPEWTAAVGEGYSALSRGWLLWLAPSTWWLMLQWALAVLLQAFLLNALVNGYRLCKRPTFVPAAMSVLVSMSVGVSWEMLPMHWANVALVLALHGLFSGYDAKKSGTLAAFSAGFWVVVAALLHSAYFAFLPFMLVGLMMMRGFEGREMVSLLLGFFVPLFWAWTYFFVADGAAAWWSGEVAARFGAAKMGATWHWSAGLILAFWALLLLFSLLSAGRIQQKTTLQEQTHIGLSYWLLLFAPLLFFCTPVLAWWHLLAAAVPLSLLAALSFQSMVSTVRMELLHLLAMMLVLLVQYAFLL